MRLIIFPEKNANGREKILLMSFIEGLRNRKHTVILRQSEPATLDEAYNLIKNEKENDNFSNVMKMDLDAQAQMDELRTKLEIALRRIQNLEERLWKSPVPENIQRSPTAQINKNPKIVCHLRKNRST